MPQPLKGSVVNFLTALALEAGAAIDAGKAPPGHSLDGLASATASW
jgi:hypothetical protein